MDRAVVRLIEFGDRCFCLKAVDRAHACLVAAGDLGHRGAVP